MHSPRLAGFFIDTHDLMTRLSNELLLYYLLYKKITMNTLEIFSDTKMLANVYFLGLTLITSG